MKKNTILSLMLFIIIKGYSQDYLISFSGTGASTTFDSIKVENLTQNKSIIVPGGNQLRLKSVFTGIYSISDDKESALLIYPNPATEFSIVELDLLKGGSITFEVFDLTGKKLAQMQSNLESGKHSYSIRGLCSGVYTVSIITEDYNYTGKIISQSNTKGDMQISYNDKSGELESKNANKLKSTQAETAMQYTTGDRLKLIGISGNYRTVLTDIPTESKTITFNFVSCTDGDNNNYPVVKIDTQIWMAEDLKTTKYRNGDVIGTTTPATLDIIGQSTPKYQWAYAGNESNVATYGRLYTWYAVTDSRNVCPTGWHVPTDAEFDTLENYLTANGYNYDGTTTGNKYAKSLASNTGWTSSTNAGAVGNTDYPAKRNATGFTALPGGKRYGNGAFVDIGSYGIWWSSTENNTVYAWYLYLYYDYSKVTRFYGYKDDGLSVRCLRDN